MRIGYLCRFDIQEVDWAVKNGFKSIGLVGLEKSPCNPENQDWKSFAKMLAVETKSRGLRVSCIGAHYGNPLDSKQTEFAKACFYRAIELAEYLKVKTVAGFSGAMIELETSSWGGNPVYKPFGNFFSQFCAFWSPIAKFAKERGIRIAFEHCPTGIYHLPIMGFNFMGQPALWEMVFNESSLENLGLEWDASHLVCQLIDPVSNIHKYGHKIFHVHAKDAYINRRLLERYGICHPGVAEHRFPGLGQSDWSEIIHALLRAGYDSDLTIEGFHDPVFQDHSKDEKSALAGRKLEKAGLILARKYLEQFVEETE